MVTDLSAGAVVPEVHEAILSVLVDELVRVHELFGEARPVADVVRAASPLKRAVSWVTAPHASVAAAFQQLTFGARPRHSEHHTGAGNCIDVGCLPTLCKHQDGIMISTAIPDTKYLQ